MLLNLIVATCVGFTPMAAISSGAHGASSVLTDTSVALTESQVRTYIAVKQALKSFWEDSAHAKLAESANATELHPAFVALGEEWSLVARVYDYPALVKSDTGLARIFTKHHFRPEQFASVQVAVHQAMLEIEGQDLHFVGTPALHTLPATIQHNIKVVTPHRAALKAAGVALFSDVPVNLRGSGIFGYEENGNGKRYYLRNMTP